MESGYTIEEINYQDTKPLILDVHYAHRMPSIQKSFGMFKDGELVGVCTYGIPPSHTLLKGVCGEEFKKDVIELNPKDHSKIHRYLKYNQRTKMYKDLNGNLLLNKDKHLEYINKVIKYL